MNRQTALLLLPFLLIGCSETRDMLGIGRNTPDEFTVVDRAPLVLPPDYNLRPPQPGAARPQEQTPSKQAEAALFDAPAPANNSLSSLDQKLLQQAGAAQAEPNIRKTLDKEAAAGVTDSRHLVDDLLWWRQRDDGSTVVDAAKESERLKTARGEGKTANDGATPVIEKRKSGWLGL